MSTTTQDIETRSTRLYIGHILKLDDLKSYRQTKYEAEYKTDDPYHRYLVER